MAGRLDLLILGVTGFTGKRSIYYVNKLCQSNGQNMSWGVAGRSKTKLEQVLKDAGSEIGISLQNIPIIIADVTDQDSLNNMARMTRVLINCCGPFLFLGEPVVKACIEAGTHHVDISAEPQFMEKIALELDQDARRKGVYIVTACGFDCVPSDLGAIFLQQHFKGTVNSIKTYLEVWTELDGVTRSVTSGLFSSNCVINSGTWDSLVHAVANWREILEYHKRLFPEDMSKYKPEIKQKILPHKNDTVGGWNVLFPTADGPSMRRTEKFFFEVEHKRPTQVNTYYNVKSFFEICLISIFALVLYTLTRFKLGCNLLIRYPGLFTLGLCRKTPPTARIVQNTHYQFTLHGDGWEDQVSSEDYQYHKPCDKRIFARVKGRDAYELTCIGVILAAITIIKEKEKLPKGGGVFSAGACFAKTSFIEKLTEHGVKFEIVPEKQSSN